MSHQPKIVLLSGPLVGETWELPDNREFVIGRDPSADIPIQDKMISRRHAFFYWDSQLQSLFVEDFQSLNGVFINGERVQQRAEVQPQDRVQMGPLIFEVDFEILLKDETKEAHSEAPQKKGHSIHGQIKDLHLSDILQMLHGSQKTGRIEILGQSLEGSLFLKEGEVYHAETTNHEGKEAFFQLFQLKEGEFYFYPHETSPSSTLDSPVPFLLLEAAQMMDEEVANTVVISPDQEFEVKLSEPLSHLQQDALELFQIIWKKRVYKDILVHSPVSAEATEQIIRQLIKDGYVVKA